MGLGWIGQRELREGLGGRPSPLPDGVVVSTESSGKHWRKAVEVALTRKTEARVAAILRQLLKTYDDVVYRAAPDAVTVVQRSAAALPGGGATRVHVRPYPPPAWSPDLEDRATGWNGPGELHNARPQFIPLAGSQFSRWSGSCLPGPDEREAC